MSDAELKEYAAKFSKHHSRAFSLPFVNLLEIIRAPDAAQNLAMRIDGSILKIAKFLDYYATIRVIEITK